MLIDALHCGTFDRATFVMLRDAGVNCVTVTCGFWEDALESFEAIGKWRDLARANADVVAIARNAAEIEAAKAGKRLAIVLGFQNTNCLGGRIAFVELFADLGVRVMQLTYNNQNEVGGSCYEEADSGLARFGREVISEMNRTGILVDCSHVGNRTTLDAIAFSGKPIAITHANPDSLVHHKRNKPDEVIKALAAAGGVIGCAVYRNITGDHYCSSVDNWSEMVARTVDIAGIAHVGIGTDYSHKVGMAELDWMRKGRWTRGANYGAGSAEKPGPAAKAEWCATAAGIGEIPAALKRRGFSDEEAGLLSGGNWLRLYRDVMGEAK